MIPGPDKIIECPKCKGLARVITLISGNSFGAQRWTDGKMIAPMLTLSPAITKCKSCNQYFWISDANSVGNFPKNQDEAENVPDDWKNAKRVRDLTKSEFLEALSLGAADSKERELHLRIRIWQAGNDPYRSNYLRSVPQMPVEDKKNLARLLELLPISQPENRIMSAEILREIGKFDEAIKMLEFPFPAGYNEGAISLIRELARDKDSLVREILDEFF